MATNVKGDAMSGEKRPAAAILADLAMECRSLVNASGLEGGEGGGWDKHDPQLTDLRKYLGEAERHLERDMATTCPCCGALVRPDQVREICPDCERDRCEVCHAGVGSVCADCEMAGEEG